MSNYYTTSDNNNTDDTEHTTVYRLDNNNQSPPAPRNNGMSTTPTLPTDIPQATIVTDPDEMVMPAAAVTPPNYSPPKNTRRTMFNSVTHNNLHETLIASPSRKNMRDTFVTNYDGDDEYTPERTPQNPMNPGQPYQSPPPQQKTGFWQHQQEIGTQLKRSPTFTRNYTNFKGDSQKDANNHHNMLDGRQSYPMFVHETLNYVFAQMCVTVSMVASMYYHKDSVNNYLNENPSLVWYPVVGTFATMLSLFCCVKRSSNCTRQILFWMFTIFCGAMVGISTIQYAPQVVLNATVTLLVIVGFLNIWAYNMAKKGHDLTYMMPTLLGGLLAIITVGILNAFIQSTLVDNCITFASIIVFSMLLVFDLNRLYTGAEENDYADPLVAAINIYLDIINIFLNLLRLLNGGSNE